MDLADALSQLRDIHMPADTTGFWPLAPGWWALIVLLLALMGWLLWRYIKKQQLQRHINAALKELDRCRETWLQQAALAAKGSPATDQNAARLDYVNGVNAVLRRVALLHFPASTVASLNGKAWANFIAAQDRRNNLSEEQSKALAHGRFARQIDIDCEALYNTARHWINDLYVARIKDKANPPSAVAQQHA
ncbi:hypothetical protein GCM10011403_11980 [Pseudohongiella nitratireducens]|uniref:DUF4381 domain-containing protein n=1 Tax=Pseudohongiella nitratireducens TaxID=1768907 RepID=A0A917GTA6_9GAMM|nr:DUF4381 domain-containing protein [Pseudohongiella nitratireducens]MDF1622430.1 DUF4381 domain-containing protein [Pseudohongiella nitratireducens]GGG56442.1 hypothetical protein GCM10011403_11980 [Pseudohongiella nitratireducens]